MSLKVASLKEISHKYSTYFFDLDGVIWKGQQKIKGGVEALNYLRSENKRLIFVTNSSIRNKEMLRERFCHFGFEAHIDQIYPADYITSLFIKTAHSNLKKLLVIGKDSLANEIRMTGKEVKHLNESQHVENLTSIPDIIKQIDKDVDGVVMGYDFQINYYKICLASFYLQNGAKLIATNPDKHTMIADYKVPGNGSFVKCLEEATGVQADVAGKPNPFILNHLIQTFKLKKQECLMIGDNLNTDIKFGINGGIDTLCVLTGTSTEQMVIKSNTAVYYSEYLL